MIRSKLMNKNTSIGIIGLGYVGLPLAVAFARANYYVTGFEIDKRKIKSLKSGISHIADISSETLQPLIESNKITVTSDFSLIKNMNVIIICVPTPLRKTKDPDISYIVSAVRKIVQYLQRGQVIVLESTTYPGTTREVLLPMIEKSGFKAGRDIFIAFSPERVDPGNKSYTISNTPKIVGGITRQCTQYACEVYEKIVNKVIPVSSSETAEMVKLLENTFRSVNIGLVNEVALMCDTLGLDTWEVIDAASSKPFGFMPFYPGPGIGGHCIPLDPQYLSWKLKMFNFYARFIELASDINSKMPAYLVRKTGDALNKKCKSIKKSRILILGVSYKKDVADIRESPALDVIELLRVKEARISYHDPYIPSFKINQCTYKNSRLTTGLLHKQDCVIIATNHSVFNISHIVRHSDLIIDARNATKGIKSKNIVKI